MPLLSTTAVVILIKVNKTSLKILKKLKEFDYELTVRIKEKRSKSLAKNEFNCMSPTNVSESLGKQFSLPGTNYGLLFTLISIRFLIDIHMQPYKKALGHRHTNMPKFKGELLLLFLNLVWISFPIRFKSLPRQTGFHFPFSPFSPLSYASRSTNQGYQLYQSSMHGYRQDSSPSLQSGIC